MEYTAPTLQVVGSAQGIVLGLNPGDSDHVNSTSGMLEVLGLDE
jgi:hypothetical protein